MTNPYFILKDGEQTGPFTFDELIEMEPDIHTRVLSPLAETWEDACDLPELFDYFRSQGLYFPTENNLASFWWRFLAYIIDTVILYFVTTFIFVFLASKGIKFNIQSYNDLLNMPFPQLLELQLISSVPLIIYNSICEASTMRGSVGKKVCGLAVVDIDGRRLSYLTALVRSVGKAFSIAIIVGFLSVFFSEHRQALHDYLAGTYVIKRD